MTIQYACPDTGTEKERSYYKYFGPKTIFLGVQNVLKKKIQRVPYPFNYIGTMSPFLCNVVITVNILGHLNIVIFSAH